MGIKNHLHWPSLAPDHGRYSRLEREQKNMQNDSCGIEKNNFRESQEVQGISAFVLCTNQSINDHNNIITDNITYLYMILNGDKNENKKGITESVQKYHLSEETKQTRKISNRNGKHERPR